MIAPTISAVERRAPDQIRIVLAVPPDHPAFTGHFPGRPILPGVVQIDWAVQLAHEYLDSAFSAGRDIQVKFRQIIAPSNPLSLNLRFDRTASVLTFAYHVGNSVASSGRIRP